MQNMLKNDKIWPLKYASMFQKQQTMVLKKDSLKFLLNSANKKKTRKCINIQKYAKYLC